MQDIMKKVNQNRSSLFCYIRSQKYCFSMNKCGCD